MKSNETETTGQNKVAGAEGEKPKRRPGRPRKSSAAKQAADNAEVATDTDAGGKAEKPGTEKSSGQSKAASATRRRKNTASPSVSSSSEKIDTPQPEPAEAKAGENKSKSGRRPARRTEDSGKNEGTVASNDVKTQDYDPARASSTDTPVEKTGADTGESTSRKSRNAPRSRSRKKSDADNASTGNTNPETIEKTPTHSSEPVSETPKNIQARPASKKGHGRDRNTQKGAVDNNLEQEQTRDITSSSDVGQEKVEQTQQTGEHSEKHGSRRRSGNRRKQWADAANDGKGNTTPHSNQGATEKDDIYNSIFGEEDNQGQKPQNQPKQAQGDASRKEQHKANNADASAPGGGEEQHKKSKKRSSRSRNSGERGSKSAAVAAAVAMHESTSKELIINVTSNEITIALLENKQLVELSKEKCKTGFAVGDIYLGKVRKIMPGLNAAFVNIGYEKDAFIHYLDLGPQFQTLQKLTTGLAANKRVPKFDSLRMEHPIGKSGKISTYLSSGQPILVQIAKEAISTKGPRLTSDISLAGRHVVLIPFSNKINISQKIRSSEERKRLKRIVDSVLPHNYGVIIRTAAVGKQESDIASDITSLVVKWEEALEKIRKQQPPSQLLSEMNRATTIIRDLLNGSFNSIVIDDNSLYEEVRDYIKQIAPEKEKIVKLYKGKVPVFDNYEISKQIQSLFAKYVSLKKGAYLIIEHTEALHVVDVNSGNRAKVDDDQERTAMNVNLAAAEEISRQLRLRDMGGIIVVDFIDLHKNDNRQLLFEKMQQLMAPDRAKHTILPLSKFGLMQITRQRVRPEAITEVSEVCPTCNGTGTITPTITLDQQIENRIAYYAGEKGMGYIKLRVSPYVAAFLNKGLISERLRWQMKYKCKIKVITDPSTGFVETKYFDKDDNELT